MDIFSFLGSGPNDWQLDYLIYGPPIVFAIGIIGSLGRLVYNFINNYKLKSGMVVPLGFVFVGAGFLIVYIVPILSDAVIGNAILVAMLLTLVILNRKAQKNKTVDKKTTAHINNLTFTATILLILAYGLIMLESSFYEYSILLKLGAATSGLIALYLSAIGIKSYALAPQDKPQT